MSKRVFFFCVMLVLTAGFAALLSELTIRLLFPCEREQSLSKFEARQRYKYRLRPNLDLSFKFAGRMVTLKTNENGLREPQSVQYDRALKEFRVVFLGDSYTKGLGLNEDETFVKVTETILKESIPCVRTINMGVGGFGPSLELLYYLEEGRRYKPDVVLIQVCTVNDVSDDARDQRFELCDGNLVERPLAISSLKLMTDFRLYQWFLDRSHLVQRIRLVMLPILYGRDLERGEEPIISESTFAKASLLTDAVWRRMVTDVRADGAIPVFLAIGGPELFPDQARPADRVPWKGRKPDFLKRSTQASEQTLAILRNLCLQMEVPCIDAVTGLRAAFADINEAFIDGDNHLSPAGSEVVARQVSDTIERLYKMNTPVLEARGTACR